MTSTPTDVTQADMDAAAEYNRMFPDLRLPEAFARHREQAVRDTVERLEKGQAVDGVEWLSTQAIDRLQAYDPDHNKAGGLWYRRWHVAQTRVNELEALIVSPPKHRFWGSGEADCPRDIKAGNGELHTLRCKVCGQDNPRDDCHRLAHQPGDGALEVLRDRASEISNRPRPWGFSDVSDAQKLLKKIASLSGHDGPVARDFDALAREAYTAYCATDPCNDFGTPDWSDGGYSAEALVWEAVAKAVVRAALSDTSPTEGEGA